MKCLRFMFIDTPRNLYWKTFMRTWSKIFVDFETWGETHSLTDGFWEYAIGDYKCDCCFMLSLHMRKIHVSFMEYQVLSTRPIPFACYWQYTQYSESTITYLGSWDGGKIWKCFQCQLWDGAHCFYKYYWSNYWYTN